MRAGIHVGECEVMDGKLTGLTVTIGARIGAVRVVPATDFTDRAGPRRRIGFRYADAGEHELKGVPGTWRLWGSGASRAEAPDSPRRVYRRDRDRSAVLAGPIAGPRRRGEARERHPVPRR